MLVVVVVEFVIHVSTPSELAVQVAVVMEDQVVLDLMPLAAQVVEEEVAVIRVQIVGQCGLVVMAATVLLLLAMQVLHNQPRVVIQYIQPVLE
jgi:hypothetical protein